MSLITDFFIGILFVTFAGTMLFVFVYSTNMFLSTVNSTGLAPTNSLPYHAGAAVASNFYAFNTYIPFIFFGFNIIAILLASYLRPNPMNIAVGVILIIFMPIISAVLSNATRTIFLAPLLLPIANEFPAILNIASQYPLYTFIFSLIYIIILAIRSRQFQGNTEVGGGGTTSFSGGGAY